MNKEQLESQWVQLRDFLRDKWGNLTEDDIRQINGRYDQLVAKLQQRYGFTKEQSEEELRKWVLERGTKTFASERPFHDRPMNERAMADRPMSDKTMKEAKSETPTFFKWLLALGLPLLLLASFLAYENSKAINTVMSPVVTQESTTTATPGDRTIIQSIQQAFADNGISIADFKNISIQSANGVVTVSGDVATQQQKDAVAKIVSSISGVKQVNNQLQVR